MATTSLRGHQTDARVHTDEEAAIGAYVIIISARIIWLCYHLTDLAARSLLVLCLVVVALCCGCAAAASSAMLLGRQSASFVRVWGRGVCVCVWGACNPANRVTNVHNNYVSFCVVSSIEDAEECRSRLLDVPVTEFRVSQAQALARLN